MASNLSRPQCVKDLASPHKTYDVSHRIGQDNVYDKPEYYDTR